MTRLIIFSSSENHDIALKIQQNLTKSTEFIVNTWKDDFFSLSSYTLQNFENINFDYDYAIIICGAEDSTTLRGKRIKTSRDNVILELGLCISMFTLKKTIVIKDQKVVLPTDLLGVSTVIYNDLDKSDAHNFSGKIASVSADLADYVRETEKTVNKLPWDEFYKSLGTLALNIRDAVGSSKFSCDVVVGVSRDGVMVADMLARELSDYKPVLALNADRRTGYANYEYDDLPITNAHVIEALSKAPITNILVVDNITRTGRTILDAKNYLQSKLPTKNVRCAVVYIDPKCKRIDEVDYYAKIKDVENKKLTLN